MKNIKGLRKHGSTLSITILTIFIVVCFGAVNKAHAQWTTNGNDISNTNSGNVGIGTASPNAKLAFGTASGAGAKIHLFDDAASFRYGMGIQPAEFQLFVPTAGHFSFNSGGDIQASGTNELMRITGGGNFGLGTTNPLYRLQIDGSAQTPSATSGSGLALGVDSTYKWIQSYNSQSLYINPLGNNVIFNRDGGNVGIGTTSPSTKLNIKDTTTGSANGQNILVLESDYIGATVGSGGRIVFKYQGGSQEAADIRAYTTGLGATGLAFGTGFGAVSPKMLIDNSGYVGIGTTTPTAKLDVNGSINVSGNINAKYQDVAEWVPSTQALSAGTVVILNPDKSNQVMASSQAYDTRVAGVVSERPGIALGEASKDKVLVATTGRVRVKVDATRAPIHVGDLLVTSDMEGVAMKSEPVDLGGVKIHRPGTLIGKALENLEKGRGEILVLLSLQ